VGLSFALLFVVYAVLLGLVNLLLPDTITLPVIGTITWVNDLVSWATVPLMLLLSSFLMIPVASMFTTFFLDDVADAVEDVHYPHLQPAPRLSLSEGIIEAVKFLGVLIAANLGAFILYLIFPPFAPVFFWALNGYLLGREYFQLIATRRLGHDGAKIMRRNNMGTVWLAGGLMAIPLSVPILNLFIPVIGAATLTHVFHRLEEPAL